MRVKVLLFGAEEKRVGRSSVDVDVASGASVADLLRCLREQCPQLAGGSGARLAVNHAFASGDETIGEHDELALIGMVSGG